MVYFENLEEKFDAAKNSSFFAGYIAELQDFYEENHSICPPQISYDDFMLFFETGDRNVYEDKYFVRRKRLTAAVILYLLYKDKKYLEEISNMIWIICSEVTWALPSHLAGCTADTYRGFIDLFAAETARALAETYRLLENELPDRIKSLIIKEITERTFDSYESRNFWWEKASNNWAAVCAGSVGMTYMYLDPERFEAVKPRIIATMNSFLSGYGDDGCCTEGVNYWYYGFSYYIMFVDMLLRFSEGTIDLLHLPKVRAISSYVQKIVLRKNITVSFADGSRNNRFNNIGLVCLLKDNFFEVALPSPVMSFNDSRLGKLSWALRNIIWANYDYLDTFNDEYARTDYFENAEWYIARRNKYSFAAKAGHNNEHHNHNDVGSFIFADDSGQLLADLGAMEYTKDNFLDDKRYSFLQNSSLGHSVPIIDGKPQKFGKEYCGAVQKVSDDEFVIEINKAYGEDAPKIVRSFELKDDFVLLTDTFEDADAHEITERFVSMIEPKIVDGLVCLGGAVLSADTIPEITGKELINHTFEKEMVYLIDYKNCGEKFFLKIEIIQ